MRETTVRTDAISNQALLEQSLDLNARLLHLPIGEEYREETLKNFLQLSQFAQLVNEFPLDDHTQPAPTFEP
jgi:hypothetical protein